MNHNDENNLSKLSEIIQERYIIAQKLIILEKQITEHVNNTKTLAEILL